MSATQKQLDANRRNSQKSTGPRTSEGKVRASLNAWRHGLTGQTALMPEEDRTAFDKFTAEIRNAYHPEGPLETQIAQSIAEDEWRLNRARAIENNVIAWGHSLEYADVSTDHPQIHAAMTQARVFWHHPEKFALLTVYEQRIARKVQRNEDRLRALQADRKAAFQQALEEARILADQAESEGLTFHAAQNGFVFSTAEFDRYRLLNHARRGPNPPRPSPAAHATSLGTI